MKPRPIFRAYSRGPPKEKDRHSEGRTNADGIQPSVRAPDALDRSRRERPGERIVKRVFTRLAVSTERDEATQDPAVTGGKLDLPLPSFHCVVVPSY